MKVSAEQRVAARSARKVAKKLEALAYELQGVQRSGGDYAASLLHGPVEKLMGSRHSLERAAYRLERYVSFDDEAEGERMADLRDLAASGDPAAQSLLERRSR